MATINEVPGIGDPCKQPYIERHSKYSVDSSVRASIQDITERSVTCIAKTCQTNKVLLLEAMEEDDVLHICASSESQLNNKLSSTQTLTADADVIHLIQNNEYSVFDDSDILAKIFFPQLNGGDRLKSGAIVPIQGYGKRFGALAVFWENTQNISEQTITFLQAIANVVSASIKLANTRETEKISITKAKQDWETSIDTFSQLVFILNEDGKVVRANRTIESWNLGNVNSVIGQHIWDLLKPLDPKQSHNLAESWRLIWENFSTNKNITFESVNQANSRHLHYILRSTSKSEDFETVSEQGNAVLIIEDITKNKTAEFALKQHNAELESIVDQRTRELVDLNKTLEKELALQKKQKAALLESKLHLRKLYGRLISAQEIERQRIAVDLHDTIGSSLGAIKFKTEELVLQQESHNDSDIHDQLNTIVTLLKNTMEDVRCLSMDLRPSILDDLGILAAVGWFCRQFESVYRSIKIKKTIELEEHDVPDSIKLVMFRIIQEAMNNVAKHAGASLIEIILTRIDSDIYLTISDNGNGFDLQSTKYTDSMAGGLGLKSMKERAYTSGASFRINSNTNGTKILVKWDVNRLLSVANQSV